MNAVQLNTTGICDAARSFDCINVFKQTLKNAKFRALQSQLRAMFPFMPGMPLGVPMPLPAISEQQPRRRGRPRGSKNHARRVTETSDEDGDFSTLVSSRRSESSNSISLRYRGNYANGQYAETTSSSSSDEEEKDGDPEPVGDGPPIQSILGQCPPDENGPRYLVKWIDQAYVHSSIVSESELKSGTKSGKILREFLGELQGDRFITSDLSSLLREPKENRTSPSVFFADRIMAHRTVEDDGRVPPELLKPWLYVPSLPLDRPAKLDVLMPWGKTFREGGGDTDGDLFMRSDGILTLDQEHSSVDNSVDPDAEARRVQKMEYLIKWRDLPANDATWEHPDRLVGVEREPLSLVNYSELAKMIDVYWKKMRGSSEQPEELRVPRCDEIMMYPFGRHVKMTVSQQEMIQEMFNSMIHEQCCQLNCDGQGRIFAVVGFLEMLKYKFHIERPFLIIVDEDTAQVWTDALRMLSSLYWIDYYGSDSDRGQIRHYEFGYPRKFDVILTNCTILHRDDGVLTSYAWSVVVIDKVHSIISSTESVSGWYTIVVTNDDPDPSCGNVIIPTKSDNFEFKERIVFVNNVFTDSLYHWLRAAMKARGIRKMRGRDADCIARDIIMGLGHPFLVPSFRSAIVRDRRRAMGMNEDIPVNGYEEEALLRFYGTKFAALLQVLRRTEISVVVASNPSLLRLICVHLKANGIQCGLLDTTTTCDRWNAEWTHGVILMTRNITSPIIDRNDIKQIVFFDVGNCFQYDIGLIQFIFQHNEGVEVVRLMLINSVEADLYTMSVSDLTFDYDHFRSKEADILLRVALWTSEDSHKRTDLPELEFTYPTESDVLYDRIGAVANETLADDFWTKAFASAPKPKVDKFDAKQALELIQCVVRLGFLDWEAAAQQMKCSLADVKIYGRGFLAIFLSRLNKIQMSCASLIHAAVWPEFHNGAYPEETDIDVVMKAWIDIAAVEPGAHLPIWGNPKVLNYLNTHVASFIGEMVNRLKIRAYQVVRSDTYVPVRYVTFPNDPITEPGMIKALLQAYYGWGDMMSLWTGIEQIQRIGIEEARFKFSLVFPVAINDIMSYVYHKADSDVESISGIPELQPLLYASKYGPFFHIWTNHELQAIIQTVRNYGIPCGPDGNHDWCEFRALAQLNTKSIEMVKEFVPYVIDALQNTPDGGSFQIPVEKAIVGSQQTPDAIRAIPLIIKPDVVSATKIILSRTNYLTKLAATNFSEFRRSPGLPEDWTIEHDYELVKGFCQFGVQNVQSLTTVDVAKYVQSDGYIPIMQSSIGQFAEYLTPENISERVKWIVFANVPVKRNIQFWTIPVRRFNFILTSESDNKQKQKRKRRTKAEMEAARILAEQQDKATEKNQKAEKPERKSLVVPLIQERPKTVPKEDVMESVLEVIDTEGNEEQDVPVKPARRKYLLADDEDYFTDHESGVEDDVYVERMMPRRRNDASDSDSMPRTRRTRSRYDDDDAYEGRTRKRRDPSIDEVRESRRQTRRANYDEPDGMRTSGRRDPHPDADRIETRRSTRSTANNTENVVSKQPTDEIPNTKIRLRKKESLEQAEAVSEVPVQKEETKKRQPAKSKTPAVRISFFMDMLPTGITFCE